MNLLLISYIASDQSNVYSEYYDGDTMIGS